VDLFEAALVSGRPFPLYISDIAEGKIREHSLKDAPRRLEVLGLLLGEVSTWNGADYVICRDVVTTKLRSSSSKVRFNPDAFPNLFLQLDDSGFDYILVGWYHSHPGHTCFLSRTDLETQRSMFDQPFHTALVVDPVNEDIRAFRLVDGGPDYVEIPFALYPSGSRSPQKGRTRRLKVKPAIQV
jgi:proteasome lid subunit RPN8/RPN11